MPDTIIAALIAFAGVVTAALGAWYYARVFRREDVTRLSLEAQLRGWMDLVNTLDKQVVRLTEQCHLLTETVTECETRSEAQSHRIAQLERRLGLDQA